METSVPGRLDTTVMDDSGNEAELFAHTPLRRNHGDSNIRLFRFCDDASQEDRIHLTMSHMENWPAIKKAMTPYTCLSYRWGDDDATHEILINSRMYRVRQNLFDFLEIWGRKEQSRNTWFWVDALCIDQSNVAERNHQVQKMGQIYSDAEKVMIWLGRRSTLQAAVEELFSIFEKGTTSRDLLFDNPDSDTQTLLRTIRMDPYWNRAWITQEIILANDQVLAVHDQTIQFSKFQAGVVGHHLHATGAIGSQPFEDILLYLEHHRPRPLVRLLYELPHRQCSIPRDRVYSLLSICAEHHKIKVDYKLPDAKLMYRVLGQSHPDLCLCEANMIARSLNLGGAATRIGETPDFEGYLTSSFSVRHVELYKLSKLKAIHGYTRNQSPGKNYDYRMSFNFCSSKEEIVVSWNKPGNPNNMIIVWTPHHPRPKFECPYGEGFQILDQGKTLPKALEQQRIHLTTLWKQYPAEKYRGPWARFHSDEFPK